MSKFEHSWQVECVLEQAILGFSTLQDLNTYKTVCDEEKIRLHACCVPPHLARELFRDKCCMVIGYPYGWYDSEAYVPLPTYTPKFIDFVPPHRYLLDGEPMRYLKAIQAVVEAACPITESRQVRVIIEESLLTNQKLLSRAINLAELAGATGIKTGSGLLRPITPERVAEIKSYTGLPIKASGGIKTLAQVEALVEAGATYVGTSSAIEIVREFRRLNPETV
jgi:deoxyribose-phosphate aldolase